MREIFDLLEAVFKDLTKKENMPARLLSLLIACLLWVYVTLDKNPTMERDFDVHLNQLNLPATMTVHNAPDTVRVHLRGPRTLFNDKTGSEISASVDLKNVVAGEQKLKVKAQSRVGAVVSVTPEVVSLYVDTISQKSVPVSIRMIGANREDTALGNVDIEPTTVQISGASIQVAKINRVVAPVDVSGKQGSFQATSELVAISDDGYDVPHMTIIPSRVQINATMMAQLLTVELPLQAVTKGKVAEGYEVKSITMQPDKLKLSAAPSQLKGLTSIKTKPLDISNLRTNITPIVELELPKNVIVENGVVRAKLEIGKIEKEHVRAAVNEPKAEISNAKEKENKHEAKN